MTAKNVMVNKSAIVINDAIGKVLIGLATAAIIGGITFAVQSSRAQAVLEEQISHLEESDLPTRMTRIEDATIHTQHDVSEIKQEQKEMRVEQQEIKVQQQNIIFKLDQLLEK